MLISKKKLAKLIEEADQNGVTRGYKMGYLMGQIEKKHNEMLFDSGWVDSRTGKSVTRLDRELEEILEERW